MSTEVEPTRAVKLYISYAPEDERLKKKLLKQLSSMKRLGVIECWDVQQMNSWFAHFLRSLKELLPRNVCFKRKNMKYISL